MQDCFLSLSVSSDNHVYPSDLNCSSHKLFKCTKSYLEKYMLYSVYNNSWNISHLLSCLKNIAENPCPYPSCCQVTENYISTSWTSLVRLPMRIYLPQYLSNCFANILISYLKLVEWQSCHSHPRNWHFKDKLNRSLCWKLPGVCVAWKANSYLK